MDDVNLFRALAGTRRALTTVKVGGDRSNGAARLRATAAPP